MTTSNGLLLVDKPQGLTSHDVVARVRRILREKKVGHAGTLDPMATGLLVLAVGPSTRLLRFAQSETKRYAGAVKFGVATDSLDADGAVVEERPVPPLTRDVVDAAAAALRGPQEQTPPMVSAIQIDGQRLHELARRGVEVDRPARAITVSAFVARRRPRITAVWRFDVECSVGTYVRVLLSDLAKRLGTVGHLVELRRLASGSHSVEDALTLDDAHRRGGAAAHGARAAGVVRDGSRTRDAERRRRRAPCAWASASRSRRPSTPTRSRPWTATARSSASSRGATNRGNPSWYCVTR